MQAAQLGNRHMGGARFLGARCYHRGSILMSSVGWQCEEATSSPLARLGEPGSGARPWGKPSPPPPRRGVFSAAPRQPGWVPPGLRGGAGKRETRKGYGNRIHLVSCLPWVASGSWTVVTWWKWTSRPLDVHQKETKVGDNDPDHSLDSLHLDSVLSNSLDLGTLHRASG